jgi:hypothetical protein
VQYAEALGECFLSLEEDKQDLKRISALWFVGDIKDNMTKKTYYTPKLGPMGSLGSSDSPRSPVLGHKPLLNTVAQD